MSSYREYPRGFVFADTFLSLPSEVEEHFEHVAVPGHFLAVDNWANVGSKIFESDFAVVIGLALHVGSETSTGDLSVIAADLLEAATRSEELLHECLYELGGRFALIIHVNETTRVYNDACGSRTVYQSAISGLVSSHVDLLLEETEHGPSDHAVVRGHLSAHWEYTGYEGIHALLPNHWLSPKTGVQTRFFPTTANRFVDMPVTDRLAEIVRVWHEQMRLVVEMGHPVAFSLTGGLDSRTLLALAKPHWGALKAFTYTTMTPNKDTKWSRSLALDVELAQNLLEIVDIPHKFLRAGSGTAPLSKADIAVVMKNSISSHGRWILPLYKNEFADPRTVHLRGNLLEIGRRFYVKKDAETPKDNLLRILMSFDRMDPNASPTEATRVFEEVRAEHATRVEHSGLLTLPNDYESLDFLYWELRMGRWIGEVANETDVAFDTFMPFNMRRIIDLFLADPDNERSLAVTFYELINREAPILNFFGINSRENLFETAHPSRRSVHRSSRDKDRKFVADITFASPASPWAEPKSSSSTLRFMPKEVVADAVLSADWEFKSQYGTAHFTMHNAYRSGVGRNRIKLLVRVDTHLVVAEDIADWSRPSHVTIHGLHRGSRISVQLQVLKDNDSKSWSRASTTELYGYEEVAVTNRIGGRTSIVASSSNPHAVTHKIVRE